MSEDSKDRRRQARTSKQELPDELVEQAKQTVIYGTGYGRPPKNTRFEKGRSGNPAGRPKRPDLGPFSSRSANALVLRAAERPVVVREGETVRQIPAIEAVLLAQQRSALGGNAYSAKHVIERFDWAEQEERQHRIDEIELWTAYVDIQRKAISDAKAAGEPPPKPLPHPDDVIIDDEKGVSFVGPLNEEQAAALDETLKMRDILIMQDALDRRMAKPLYGDPLDGPGTAMVFVDLLNRTVPKRHRLSDTEILLRIARCETLTKRELLKRLYRDWRSIGANPRRGRIFPRLRFAKDMVEQIDQVVFRTAQTA